MSENRDILPAKHKYEPLSAFFLEDDITMARDRVIGAALVIGAIIGVFVYGYLIIYFPVLILQITAFVAVIAILAILGWIGYVMATTPPPVPLEPEPSTTTAEGSQPAPAQSATSEKK